jgi:hypothetical protein
MHYVPVIDQLLVWLLTRAADVRVCEGSRMPPLIEGAARIGNRP